MKITEKIKKQLAIGYAARSIIAPDDRREFAAAAPFIVKNQLVLEFIMGKENSLEERRIAFRDILPEVHAYMLKHPKAAKFFADWEAKGKEKLEVS